MLGSPCRAEVNFEFTPKPFDNWRVKSYGTLFHLATLLLSFCLPSATAGTRSVSKVGPGSLGFGSTVELPEGVCTECQTCFRKLTGRKPFNRHHPKNYGATDFGPEELMQRARLAVSKRSEGDFETNAFALQKWKEAVDRLTESLKNKRILLRNVPAEVPEPGQPTWRETLSAEIDDLSRLLSTAQAGFNESKAFADSYRDYVRLRQLLPDKDAKLNAPDVLKQANLEIGKLKSLVKRGELNADGTLAAGQPDAFRLGQLLDIRESIQKATDPAEVALLEAYRRTLAKLRAKGPVDVAMSGSVAMELSNIALQHDLQFETTKSSVRIGVDDRPEQLTFLYALQSLGSPPSSADLKKVAAAMKHHPSASDWIISDERWASAGGSRNFRRLVDKNDTFAFTDSRQRAAGGSRKPYVTITNRGYRDYDYTPDDFDSEGRPLYAVTPGETGSDGEKLRFPVPINGEGNWFMAGVVPINQSKNPLFEPDERFDYFLLAPVFRSLLVAARAPLPRPRGSIPLASEQKVGLKK